MGNMCAKEREKGFEKQWDPNSEKMKKRVRAMRRALAQALLEGEVEQTKNKQHIKNLKATRDNILRMSAGTEEDDFSRMSREAREKRRKKKALALDIGDDIASKDDTEDIVSAQEYDARETYNTQANSPRRNYKPETVEPNVYQQFSKAQSHRKAKPDAKRVSFNDEIQFQVTNNIDDDSDSALPLDTI